MTFWVISIRKLLRSSPRFHSSKAGKVTGKIRYGKVVIEEGGQLSGDIECSVAGSAKSSSSAAKPSMALAA